jgi:hypothetical protein
VLISCQKKPIEKLTEKDIHIYYEFSQENIPYPKDWLLLSADLNMTIEEFLDMKPGELDIVIVRNQKPIGICECKGKGKDSCRGNGWIKDGAGYQKCPYFEEFSK